MDKAGMIPSGKMIALTAYPSGSEIWTRVDNIISVVEGASYTAVHTVHGPSFNVKEMPHVVASLVEGTAG